MATLRRVEFAEEGPEIRVPSDPETVFPAPENGVAGFELEVGFFLAAPEARGTYVADVVGEVGVQGTDVQGDV